MNDVAFGPDGQLATTGDDGAVRVWDVREETMLAEVTGRGEVWSPSFAAQGPTRFAAVWPDEMLMRVATVERDGSLSVEEHQLPDRVGWVGEAQLSPDGTWMAVMAGGPPKVVIVDADTGELRRRLGWDAPAARAVEISPDGRWVAVGTDRGRRPDP